MPRCVTRRRTNRPVPIPKRARGYAAYHRSAGPCFYGVNRRFLRDIAQSVAGCRVNGGQGIPRQAVKGNLAAVGLDTHTRSGPLASGEVFLLACALSPSPLLPWRCTLALCACPRPLVGDTHRREVKWLVRFQLAC